MQKQIRCKLRLCSSKSVIEAEHDPLDELPWTCNHAYDIEHISSGGSIERVQREIAGSNPVEPPIPT